MLKENDKERRNECETNFQFNVKEEEESASKYKRDKSVVIERQKHNQERQGVVRKNKIMMNNLQWCRLNKKMEGIQKFIGSKYHTYQRRKSSTLYCI